MGGGGGVDGDLGLGAVRGGEKDVVAVAVGGVQIGGRGVGAAVPLAGNVRCFLTLQTDDECRALPLGIAVGGGGQVDGGTVGTAPCGGGQRTGGQGQRLPGGHFRNAGGGIGGRFLILGTAADEGKRENGDQSDHSENILSFHFGLLPYTSRREGFQTRPERLFSPVYNKL